MANLVLFYEGAFNVFDTTEDLPVFWRGVTLQELTAYWVQENGVNSLWDFHRAVALAVRRGVGTSSDYDLDTVVEMCQLCVKDKPISAQEFIRNFLSFHNNAPPVDAASNTSSLGFHSPQEIYRRFMGQQ